MSTDREVTRIVRSWLEEGVTALPDRVLDAVLDQVPATRQRRAGWPARRFAQMNTFAKIAIATAAVVVIAFVGINLMPNNGSVGGVGGPTAAPSQTETASPTPIPSPSALTVTSGGPVPIAPGSYIAADPFPLQVTFTVPAGWEGNIGGPNLVELQQSEGQGLVAFSIFQKVYADPCHYKGLLNPLPGPTVDDLASALAKVPGLGKPTPSDVTFAGYTGKQLTLTAPTTFAGCSLTPDGRYRVWELPAGATNDLNPGAVERVWILAVGGQRLVIDASKVTGQTGTEVQAILDSVKIAP